MKIWTKERENQLRELCFLEKSNKEISEIMDLKIEYVRQARSRLGLTIEKVKAELDLAITKVKGKNEKEVDIVINRENCFGYISEKVCDALTVKNCTGCNFFKTHEQKAKDDERTRKRLQNTAYHNLIEEKEPTSRQTK